MPNNCDIKVVSRKVMNAKRDINGIVDGLARDTFDLYISIRRVVDQSMVEVSKRLKKVFGCSAMVLQ